MRRSNLPETRLLVAIFFKLQQSSTFPCRCGNANCHSLAKIGCSFNGTLKPFRWPFVPAPFVFGYLYYKLCIDAPAIAAIYQGVRDRGVVSVIAQKIVLLQKQLHTEGQQMQTYGVQVAPPFAYPSYNLTVRESHQQILQWAPWLNNQNHLIHYW